MDSFSVVTWNIRQGGKKFIREIVDSLYHHQADIIVLTEYKDNEAGEYLIAKLQEMGWTYIVSTSPVKNENGVLILSVFPMESCVVPYSCEQGAHRWNEIYVPSLDMYLLGVHVPNINETYSKQFFWEQITYYAVQHESDCALIIGDFNTARRDEKAKAPLKYNNYLMDLIDKGWTDAWKYKHEDQLGYSWYSHKRNGDRLDYAFLSPKLFPALTSCELLEEELKNNYSDHAILKVDFAEIE